MANREQWKYVVTPTFIARFMSGQMEILRLDTDQWEACKDPAIHSMVVQDGTIVPEKEALETHEIYKKTLI